MGYVVWIKWFTATVADGSFGFYCTSVLMFRKSVYKDTGSARNLFLRTCSKENFAPAPSTDFLCMYMNDVYRNNKCQNKGGNVCILVFVGDCSFFYEHIKCDIQGSHSHGKSYFHPWKSHGKLCSACKCFCLSSIIFNWQNINL